MSDRPKPSIERAYTEVQLAREAVDTAYRSLQSARRRLDDAMGTFRLIHPGNPISPYAPTGDEPMSDRTIEMMNLEMADEICDLVELRQEKFGEPLDVSIKVVLFNYGDGRRIAHCVNGEWSGPKADLVSENGGIPHCPNGHVCTEEAEGWGLALVDGHDPWGPTHE